MKSFLAFLAVVSFLPATVLGHGRIKAVTIDGTMYTGPDFNTALASSPIRQVSKMDPIYDVKSTDMACGNGGADVLVAKSATAKPGSKVDFAWTSGAPGTDWPHNVGPMLTYIASCGGADCSTFKATSAKWVKIDEAGYTDKAATVGDGTWIQDATAHSGKVYTMNLPSDLPSGNYLLRHEIAALHVADTKGAEFYPSCTQLKVTGGSSGKFDDSKGAIFSALYKGTEIGLTQNIYTPTGKAYEFPGPELVTASSVSGNSNNNTSTNKVCSVVRRDGRRSGVHRRSK